jgi:hypothetical protein
MLYRGDDPIQRRSTKNRPVFGLSSSFGEPQPKPGFFMQDDGSGSAWNENSSRQEMAL